MRTLSWNKSGAARKWFNNQTKNFNIYPNPTHNILVETKSNSNKAQAIIRSINMPEYIEICLEGFLRKSDYYGNIYLIRNHLL